VTAKKDQPMTKHYFKALARLLKGKPRTISHPYKINKDTVALEAGHKRGSIKKSRDSHREIILAIEKAQEEGISMTPSKKAIGRAKEEAKTYKQKYHASVNRELLLHRRVRELEGAN